MPSAGVRAVRLRKRSPDSVKRGISLLFASKRGCASMSTICLRVRKSAAS